MEKISALKELNDDCLNHLFQFLELEDVVRLNLVSQRFRTSAQQWMSRWMANNEFTELSDLAYSCHVDPCDFLAVFGNCIKHITVFIPQDDKKHLNALPECCKNLENLNLEITKVTKNIDMTFLGRMQSVRGLVVEGKVGINVLEEIINLQNLERLRIESDSFTGSRLDELKNLKELNLSFCEKVTTEHFINAFRANRNLTRINIIGCGNIGPEAYRSMVKELRPLESLEFDADSLLKRKFIPGLNHLKNLTIGGECYSRYCELILRGYSNTLGETLTSLTINDWADFDFSESLRFPNLIELIVPISEVVDVDVLLRTLSNICPRLERVTFGSSWYMDVTPDVILDFFRQSKNLVYADIHIPNCYSVSLYKAIVAIRKTLSMIRTLKLTIHGRSHYYDEMVSYMKGDDYAAFKKFVEIENKY